MRLLSTAALSLVLATSAGLIMPAAALAKKEDKADQKGQAKPPQASAKFAKPAIEVQKLIAANDYDGALAKMAEAEAAASTPDDSYFLGSFYINIGAGKKDQAMQRKGLDMMLASGKVAAEQLGKYEVEAGKLAQVGKDMVAAREHYNKAIAAGNKSSDPLLMLAESYFGEAYEHIEKNQLTAEGKALAQQGLPYLRKAIDTEKAAGQAVPGSWFVRGMKMSVLSASPDQGDWAKLTLKNAPSSENWRLALRSLQDANPTITRDENVDLLRLMRASNSLADGNGSGAYSYSEYAEAAWRLGLPGEVLSLIDSGLQRGELKQGSLSDLYKLAQTAAPKDKASLAASEAAAAKAPTGKPAANTANAYFGYDNFAKAAELYRLALQKGSVNADEVNTRLGIALARSGDAAGARTAFAAVAGPSIRKQVADLWIVWLDGQASTN